MKNSISIIISIFIFFLCTLYINNSSAQNWVPKGLGIDGEDSINLSGYSIAMSSEGQSIAIGAPTNNGNGIRAGHVRVFSWSGSTWVQKGLDIEGDTAQDRSGNSISLSSDGNTLAIGSKYNSKNGKNAGHVRVFIWNDTAWKQMGFDIEGEASEDEFGWSVGLSSDGSTLVVGAPGNNGNGSLSGHVRVFTWKDSKWQQRGSDLNGEAPNDLFGQSVSISSDGEVIAVGTNSNNGNGNGAGHVRVYKWGINDWLQKGSDIDGDTAGELLGSSVSLSANGYSLAVGATGSKKNGANSGSVKVFKFDGLKWTQKGSIINGEGADDRFGHSVGISSDGNTFVAGSPYNNGSGVNAGHARVFTWTANKWEQIGLDIDGEASGDRFGQSVSISADGKSIAAGAIYNNGNGKQAGQVRVFEYCTNTYGTTPLITSNCSYESPSGKLWYNSGTYSDTITNVAGCDSILTINLIIKPTKLIAIQPNDTNAIEDDSIYFVVKSNSGTYQWQIDSGLGFQNLTHTGQFKGSNTDSLFIVNLALTNNSHAFRCICHYGSCGDTSDIVSVKVKKNIGIATYDKRYISVYPNPTKGLINIKLATINNDVIVVEIINTVGEIMFSQELLQSDHVEINMHGLKSGIYMVRLSIQDYPIIYSRIIYI